MSEVYSNNYGMGYTGTWAIDNAVGCDTNESYLTDGIIILGNVTQINTQGGTYTLTLDGISNVSTGDIYCLYVEEVPSQNRALLRPQSNKGFNYITTESETFNNVIQFPYTKYNSIVCPNIVASMMTNLPIFPNASIAGQYLLATQTEVTRRQLINDYAINIQEQETIPDGFDFSIVNAWTTGEWTEYGQPPVNFVNYRCLRGRITSGRMCYYPVAGISDGSLKYQIVSNAEFYALETSTDGTSWTPVVGNQLPFDFFYRPHVDELGTCNYGLSYDNDGIPRFTDDEKADDYIDNEINEIDADNWDEISDRYPDPQISVGEPDEDPTEMGEVYTRAFFSQQYICSSGAMSEIANALFDTDPTGLWEDIKKGLEMYGDSPVDDIQGCMFFPFNLNEVFTNTQSQNYIYFGGYRFDLQNNSVNKILYPNGHIDFGSWTCPLRFGGSYRDYEPYRSLSVYLPYIGWAQLDLKRYLGKSVSVKYYIDTRTGGCMACLFAGGILYDYFNGQIGISMPITATDFVAYANAQINTLLGGAGAMKNNAGTIAGAGGKLVESGVASAGAVALGMTPVAGLAVGAGVAKTMYGLTQNNINNFNVTRGASSSMLNAYLPQNVMFLDEVQQGTATPNEKSLMGYPSNASGSLQNFSGYLEVDAVNLICDTATDNERAEIMALLRSGVYI